jgi:hypothetical protein
MGDGTCVNTDLCVLERTIDSRIWHAEISALVIKRPEFQYIKHLRTFYWIRTIRRDCTITDVRC